MKSSHGEIRLTSRPGKEHPEVAEFLKEKGGQSAAEIISTGDDMDDDDILKVGRTTISRRVLHGDQGLEMPLDPGGVPRGSRRWNREGLHGAILERKEEGDLPLRLLR